jgi:hypothetical protein
VNEWKMKEGDRLPHTLAMRLVLKGRCSNAICTYPGRLAQEWQCMERSRMSTAAYETQQVLHQAHRHIARS